MSKLALPLSIIGCTLTLALCSCRGQREGRSVEEIAHNIVVSPIDTTLYCSLVAIKNDSLILRPEYEEDECSYAYLQALGEGNIKGELREGDNYSITVDKDLHRVLHMLNHSQLTGQWFYDIDEMQGMTFTAAGALSSINAKDFTFRKWKVLNGNLLLYYLTIEEDGSLSQEIHVDTTKVEGLSNELLEFNFRGHHYCCRRLTKPIKVKMEF